VDRSCETQNIQPRLSARTTDNGYGSDLRAVRYRTDVVGNDVQHEKHPAFLAGGCQRFEVRLHAPRPDEILVLNHTAESAQTHQPSPSSHTDYAGVFLHWELQGRRL
jgi:hypothetical protein